MKPAQGDSVKFTDRFLANSPYPWTAALKDVELLVTKLTLRFAPFKVYTIFFMAGNMMYKIDINETGQLVDNNNNPNIYDVFELFYSSASASFTVGAPLNPQHMPIPAWVPNAPAQPSRPVSEDEANANCPMCGAPAVDLIFSVKCTNPDCKNYR